MNHSYPWYVADWRLSEARIKLNLEQRSLYRELLDYLFYVGSLPVDPKLLCNIAGATTAEFKRSWPAVSSYFYQTKEGTLTNRKAAEVLVKLSGYQEKRREAAKTAAHARWTNIPDAPRMPDAMPDACVVDAHPQPLTSSSSSSVSRPHPQPAPATPKPGATGVQERVKKHATLPGKHNPDDDLPNCIRGDALGYQEHATDMAATAAEYAVTERLADTLGETPPPPRRLAPENKAERKAAEARFEAQLRRERPDLDDAGINRLINGRVS